MLRKSRLRQIRPSQIITYWLTSVQNNIFFFAHQRLVFNTGFFTVRSAAPQTALWEGPGRRFEPWMGSLEAGTQTTRPPHHLWATNVIIGDKRHNATNLICDKSHKRQKPYNETNIISDKRNNLTLVAYDVFCLWSLLLMTFAAVPMALRQTPEATH